MTLRQRKVLRRARELFPIKRQRVRWLLAVRYLRSRGKLLMDGAKAQWGH